MAPNEKRERMLDLLTGPALEVVIVAPKSSNEKSWTLPKALLCHNSGYFQRLRNFKEGHEGKVTLTDFDPDIFKMFVEFLYFGRYSYRDKLEDHNRTRDSAKAWVMGDYLDAVEFKNFAIKNLHEIYFPTVNAPKSPVSIKMLNHCSTNSTFESPLCQLYLAFLIKHWHNNDLIVYNTDNREEWAKFWIKYPEFSETLHFCTNQHDEDRKDYPCLLSELLETATITEEPQVAHEPEKKTDSLESIPETEK